jgi:hypothetical protein
MHLKYKNNVNNEYGNIFYPVYCNEKNQLEYKKIEVFVCISSADLQAPDWLMRLHLIKG